MKQFQHNQQVRIVDPDPAHLGMEGWTGKVARCRHCDDGAWVEMDRDLPKWLRAFDDPEDSRFRHILLFPDECKPVTPATRP
jgi:hypothetical protein